jgi:ADP-ribose 1''-phosphate phosphatase
MPVTYITGDLFLAPPNSILIHACNTLGSWGAGIALAFRSKFPDAFEIYKAHCKAHSNEELIGTCLVIRSREGGHDIACLFTSRAYGRRKDPPEEILNATRGAIKDLQRQNDEGKALHACRINSGKFAVPWALTAAILEELGAEMTIYDPVEAK